MADKKEKINEIAVMLEKATITAVPVADPVTVMAPELDLNDAYAIQLLNVDRALSRGERIAGKKIGLTSLAMQQMFGVNEPDYGHLLESMDVSDGKLRAADCLQPRVEGEIAFILKSDISGPNATVADVLAATDYVAAAIEIVDSRIRDWKIKLIDTVSDNGSSCAYVIGKEKVFIPEISLPEIKMTLYKNGEKINEGMGADVLGDPALCVAWLANKLWEYGVTLKAGEIVLSGALSAAVPAGKGDSFEARFSAPMGSVSVEFT